MPLLLGAIFSAAAIYQALASLACLRQLFRPREKPGLNPGVSILKPIRGLDLGFEAAIRSHAQLDYRPFEILFGVSDPADPALAVIEKLQRDYPDVSISIHVVSHDAPNGKVGVLTHLRRHARYPVIVVNDSDITVPPDYLVRITAPLADPAVGLVTCLYRACGASFPARWEALGIATDFAPSVLVAPLFGVNEFALGSTLAFRAADLERSGGFEAIAAYLADDYQLGRRMRQLGLGIHLSTLAVETHLGAGSWSDVWRHQVRWARTIRLSRGAGYAGLPVTNASLWCVVLALAGWSFSAAILLVLRLLTAALAAILLNDRHTAKLLFLTPFRDLWSFAVWLAGLTGEHVFWRGERLKITSDGRLQRIQ